jgi:hypothetical protein
MKPIVLNINILGEEGKALKDLLNSLSGKLEQGQPGPASPGQSVEPTGLEGLDREQMHFLKVFVMCEGKIKEVEKALGVSYPTVKGKLADLKDTIERSDQASGPGLLKDDGNTGAVAPKPSSDQANQILELLSNGELTYEQALAKLKESTGGR